MSTADSPCRGPAYDTQLDANIARAIESMKFAEEHYTVARFETWYCDEGHYHFG